MLKNFHYILSLLYKHQNHRRPIQQLHTQLIFAHKTFEFHHSLALWNSLIRHYALGIFPQEALFIFKHLQHLGDDGQHGAFDSFSYSFLIKASANLGWPGLGKQLHCYSSKVGFEFHVYVGTALVDMYGKCGCLVEARKMFDEMPERNSVTWNALITSFIRLGDMGSALGVFDLMPERNVVSWTGIIDGYTRMGRFCEALLLFRRMIAEEGIRPSEVTLLAVFPAIWNVRDVGFCRMIHGFGEKTGFNVFDVRVMNCLVDAYAKCGSIHCAWMVFEDILDEKRSLVTWTSIISGFAMHGMAEEAFEVFRRMESTGMRPNRITFLSVVNACSHSGLVDEGLEFSRKMVDECGISPDIKHYGCLIDMLGRAGRLEEAEKIAEQVPSDIDNVVVWRTLLGACSFHGNIEMAERVTKMIMEMHREYGGDYVLLSNIFAGAGRYSDSERVREDMDVQNAAKVPGLSFV